MSTLNLKVRAFIDDTGNVDFDIDGVKAKQARLRLGKDTGQHAIHFRLQDDTARKFRFDTEDPIWVDEDGPCPPSPGISTDQLSVAGCTQTVLSAINANSGRPRELRYQLNFVAADGSPAGCDPIIDNGGGGRA
jgi:hypothetical protein